MDTQPQDITDLQEVILLRHGCRSSYCRTELVADSLAGHPDWDGLVKVFDLYGHPMAECCFAWNYRAQGVLQPVTVLKLPPIDTPASAVRMFLDPVLTGPLE